MHNPSVMSDIREIDPAWNIEGGGRIAWITVANEARLNCLSTDLVTGIRVAFGDLAQRLLCRLALDHLGLPIEKFRMNYRDGWQNGLSICSL